MGIFGSGWAPSGSDHYHPAGHAGLLWDHATLGTASRAHQTARGRSASTFGQKLMPRLGSARAIPMVRMNSVASSQAVVLLRLHFRLLRYHAPALSRIFRAIERRHVRWVSIEIRTRDPKLLLMRI